MINTTKIYLVTNCYGDPNKVYIGKTKNSRKINHKITYGIQIEYTYIDELSSLDRKDWVPLESFWIEYFKFLGFEVLNKNKGGGGPSFYTDEIIQKMKNRVFSEEHKQKIREGKLGKKNSKEHNQKISKSRLEMKIKQSEETINKRIKNQIGKKHSDEWKENISKSLRKHYGKNT